MSCKVKGLRFGVQVFGFGVCGLWFRIWGLGFRVYTPVGLFLGPLSGRCVSLFANEKVTGRQCERYFDSVQGRQEESE